MPTNSIMAQLTAKGRSRAISTTGTFLVARSMPHHGAVESREIEQDFFKFCGLDWTIQNFALRAAMPSIKNWWRPIGG
jgi:hypothetical protein